MGKSEEPAKLLKRCVDVLPPTASAKLKLNAIALVIAFANDLNPSDIPAASDRRLFVKDMEGLIKHQETLLHTQLKRMHTAKRGRDKDDAGANKDGEGEVEVEAEDDGEVDVAESQETDKEKKAGGKGKGKATPAKADAPEDGTPKKKKRRTKKDAQE